MDPATYLITPTYAEVELTSLPKHLYLRQTDSRDTAVATASDGTQTLTEINFTVAAGGTYTTESKSMDMSTLVTSTNDGSSHRHQHMATLLPLPLPLPYPVRYPVSVVCIAFAPAYVTQSMEKVV